MSKFKVGDRVRLVSDENDHLGLVRGDVGTVAEDSTVPFVDWDRVNDKWAVLENEFEPVAVAPATATLTIESGKFYKTRDGRKVGPMRRGRRQDYPWVTDDSALFDGFSRDWRENGTFHAHKDNHPADLIAEWVDEPSAPVTVPITFKLGVEFVPFPQVGDAVLIPGVISAINQSHRGTNYNIVFETQNRRMSLHFLEEDFILDEDGDDEGDCPCANNDNGPVPSADTAKAFDALGDWLRAVAINPSAAFRANKEAA